MAIPTSPFARYRASQLALSDTDPVGTWADEGSGGNDLTQTGAARPTFEVSGFNGNASVLFDGTDDFMQTAAYTVALAQPSSIVVMGEYVTVDAAGIEVVFDGAMNTARQTLLHDGTIAGDPWVMVAPTARQATDTPVGKAGDDLCIVCIYDATASEMHVNDGGNILNVGGVGESQLDSFSLMARFDGFATLAGANMRIVEVLIYDRALNSTELTDLQDYFTSTYVTSATNLDGTDATQAQTATAAALTQVHELQPTSAVQGQSATAATLVQTHALTATDAVQAQTADTAAVTEGVTLSPADAVHAQTVTQAALTQLHELLAASAVQAQIVTLPVVTEGEIPEPEPIVLPTFRESAVPDYMEATVPSFRERALAAYQEGR